MISRPSAIIKTDQSQSFENVANSSTRFLPVCYLTTATVRGALFWLDFFGYRTRDWIPQESTWSFSLSLSLSPPLFYSHTTSTTCSKHMGGSITLTRSTRFQPWTRQAITPQFPQARNVAHVPSQHNKQSATATFPRPKKKKKNPHLRFTA